MAKINKMHVLVGLLIFLILILLVRPSVFQKLYSSVLGRILLVFAVIFFAMNSITLGLLCAFIIIIASSMYFTEGLETMDNTSKKNALTKEKPKKIDMPKPNSKPNSEPKVKPETKDKPETTGVDLETIKETIKAKASSSLPVTPPSSTEKVAPSSVEPFRSMFSSV
jgi:hypothetical protein